MSICSRIVPSHAFLLLTMQKASPQGALALRLQASTSAEYQVNKVDHT